MGLLVFLVTLSALLLIGVPIAIALGGCAIVLMLFLDQFQPLLLAQQMIVGVNSFPLMAIPFFMLAGEIMSKGGLSKRIVDFANVLMGRIRGGLGYTAIVASIIFAGLSGSAVADAAALGGILLPLMAVQGYKTERAAGFICAGAIIAPIIPPSIPMIVLGTSVGLSISRMFMSGIVPGLIIGIALMVVWYFVVRIDDYHDVVHFTREEGLKMVISSLPALFMPILIVGGIRLGIFTPTEAGAFAVVYAVFVCFFIYRELTWKKLVECLIAACKSTATVMFICATASAVAWLITIAQIPAMAVQLFGGLIAHPVLLMIVISSSHGQVSRSGSTFPQRNWPMCTDNSSSAVKERGRYDEKQRGYLRAVPAGLQDPGGDGGGRHHIRHLQQPLQARRRICRSGGDQPGADPDQHRVHRHR